MAILRTIHDSHFTTVANETIRDKALSFKAKGLLFLLLSCSDNWTFTESWIASQSSDGTSAVKSALHELENAHYLKRYRLRNEDGTLGESVYEVHERPFDSTLPIAKEPMLENPTLDNDTLRNNNSNSINNNTEKQLKNTHSVVEEIVSYLNQKADKKYRASSKQTASLIKARLSEGFKVDDFKKVIDNKVADWKPRKDMEQYLRPETLFGTKFEGYLNENKSTSSKPKEGYRRA